MSASVHAGIPPPPRSRHPSPEQTPPESRHTPMEQTPPREQTPPGADPPQEQTPPPREVDTGIRSMSVSGRYASYWNAFLLRMKRPPLRDHGSMEKEGRKEFITMMKSYDEILDKMETFCQSKTDCSKERRELRNLKQGDGQTYLEYVYEVSEKFEQCHYEKGLQWCEEEDTGYDVE